MIRELDSWDLAERIHERCGDRCRNGEGDDKSLIALLNNDPDKTSDRFCEENSDALGFSCNDLTCNEMGIESTNPDCIRCLCRWIVCAILIFYSPWQDGNGIGQGVAGW